MENIFETPEETTETTEIVDVQETETDLVSSFTDDEYEAADLYEDIDVNELNKPNEIIEEEEEEEEEGNENLDVDVLNKLFGTNKKSIDEFKDLLKKEEEPEKNEINIEKIEVAQKRVELFDSKIQMDARELLFEDNMLRFYDDAKKSNTSLTDEDIEEFKETLNEKLDSWDEAGSLLPNAQILKTKLKEYRDLNKNIVDNYNQQKKQEEEKNKEVQTEKIQSAFNKHFEDKTFMGVSLTKDLLLNAYKKIDEGNFIEMIQKNPDLQVKLALFLETQELIQKRSEQPTKSDGIREVLDELKPGTSKTKNLSRSKKTTTTVRNHGDDFISAWLK